MGLHTAVGLAGRGVTVVATMRDPDRDHALRQAAETAGVQLDVRPLDVTDGPAATRCIDQVLATYGRIDILVNNAGRGSVASLEQLTMDALRAQLEVNYLGVARADEVGADAHAAGRAGPHRHRHQCSAAPSASPSRMRIAPRSSPLRD